MTATNDDLLLEMQKQTQILKSIKKILKAPYTDKETVELLKNE